MAIVKQYTTPEGTTIIIRDDCYKNDTPEETKKKQENIQRVADELYTKLVKEKMLNSRKEAAV